jgi:thiosulfate dehydrogenase [quinone] large subunit
MTTTIQPTPLVMGESTRLTRWCIAVVRIGVALMWIQNASWKTPPDFGEADNSDLYVFTRYAIEYPVLPPFAALIDQVVLPNFVFFGWVTLLTESALGAFLLIGLLTRFWAVVGVAQCLAIMFSVLNAPHEWHWSYYLMILAHVAIFATAAGRAFGVDGVLRPSLAASESWVGRLLRRLS